MEWSRRAVLGALGTMSLSGCLTTQSDEEDTPTQQDDPEKTGTPTEEPSEEPVDDGEEPTQDDDEQNTVDWTEAFLTDIDTGDTFTIGDYSDQIVLVESFAVWCPACLSQQRQIQAFHEEYSDAAVSVSLNTDPNEDADKVRAHRDRHGFDWTFAVASSDVTNALVDEFGLDIVHAPFAPMVLICQDGSRRFLSQRSVKQAETLYEEIQTC